MCLQLTKFKVQVVKVPLEKLVVDSCHSTFASVLSDLSGLSLRLEQPAADGGGGGRSQVGGVRRFGAPGAMENGRFFLTELFNFAKEVVSENGDSVSPQEPFTEEVSH